jgi:hypothetical protein
MAGQTCALVWLVMPLDVAKPLSVMVVVAAILLVATQLIRMVRRHRREAWQTRVRPCVCAPVRLGGAHSRRQITSREPGRW